MSPDRLTALRNFFACAEPRLPHTVAVMFSKLAETAPEIRQLFKDDPEIAQARYLLMLRRIVQLTRSKHLWPVQAFTGTASIPALAGLGYSHARMGITREHFDKMKVALGQSFGEDSPGRIYPGNRRSARIYLRCHRKVGGKSRPCTCGGNGAQNPPPAAGRSAGGRQILRPFSAWQRRRMRPGTQPPGCCRRLRERPLRSPGTAQGHPRKG